MPHRGNRFGLRVSGLDETFDEFDLDPAFAAIGKPLLRHGFRAGTQGLDLVDAYRDVILCSLVSNPDSLIVRVRNEPIPQCLGDIAFATVEKRFHQIGGQVKLHPKHIKLLDKHYWKSGPFFNLI